MRSTLSKLAVAVAVAVVGVAGVAVMQARQAAQPARDMLLVTTSKLERATIFKVDGPKLTEIKKLPIGKYALEVMVSPDGRRAYVSNGDSNSITVIDLDKLEVVTTITHPDLLVPDGGTFTADSKTLYVVSEKRNSVFVIDTATNKVLKEIPTEISVPRRVTLSPDERKLYIAGNKTPAIGVIDVAAGKFQKLFKVGREPRGGLVFLPDGKTLLTASVEDDTLYLLNVETGEVPLIIGVPGSPQRVFVAPGGSPIYVAARMECRVAMIKDLYTHDSRKFADTGKYPWGMAVTPDFKFGFVANTSEASLSVIDLVEMKTLATVPVDKDTCGVALRK